MHVRISHKGIVVDLFLRFNIDDRGETVEQNRMSLE
jgi:hypothetical protein